MVTAVCNKSRRQCKKCRDSTCLKEVNVHPRLSLSSRMSARPIPEGLLILQAFSHSAIRRPAAKTACYRPTVAAIAVTCSPAKRLCLRHFGFCPRQGKSHSLRPGRCSVALRVFYCPATNTVKRLATESSISSSPSSPSPALSSDVYLPGCLFTSQFQPESRSKGCLLNVSNPVDVDTTAYTPIREP